jgi:hypothetical protein
MAKQGVMEVRRAGERGRTNWGWLDNRDTFSFATNTTRITWVSILCE